MRQLYRRACECCADGKGAYAAVEPIGGEITKKMIQSLRDDATLLFYSLMADYTSPVRPSSASS